MDAVQAASSWFLPAGQRALLRYLRRQMPTISSWELAYFVSEIVELATLCVFRCFLVFLPISLELLQHLNRVSEDAELIHNGTA